MTTQPVEDDFRLYKFSLKILFITSCDCLAIRFLRRCVGIDFSVFEEINFTETENNRLRTLCL